MGRDVPKEHTSGILFNVLEGSDVRLSTGWAGMYLKNTLPEYFSMYKKDQM